VLNVLIVAGARTEEYCIVYKPAYEYDDDYARTWTNDAISQIASTMTNTKPYKIIPLPNQAFHKTALGKLSRAKFRSAFEAGEYQLIEAENEKRIHDFRVDNCQRPSNATEEAILDVICEQLEIRKDEVSTTTNIFHLGFTSLDFFSFTRRLQSYLQTNGSMDLTDILRDPTIKGIAEIINVGADPDALYDPVVPLQTSGDKTPLWIVHPASGNILAFIPLARSFHDRPVYGLRSTGVKPGERLFKSMAEMATTYAAAIQRKQPQGPYAISGYSLGSSIAFEIAKILEAKGESVPFVGALDSPPNIAPLVGNLTWSAGLVMVSFFYELIPERYANEVIPRLWNAAPDAALDFILEHANPERLASLQLDRRALSHVADLASNFSHCAGEYAVTGNVKTMDVFVVNPLLSVADSREMWLNEFLVDWKAFVRQGVEFHQCEGSHADMLGQKYIQSFQKTLKLVLKQRGL
jgi:thioesterase domain-containing protein/acyl carrier protein